VARAVRSRRDTGGICFPSAEVISRDDDTELSHGPNQPPPGYCPMQDITKRWWNSWRTQFEIFVSDIVLQEATAGDPQAAQRRWTVLEGFPILESDGYSRAFAERIVEISGLPSKALADAEHVALAAMRGLEFLLTWNCAHLANPHITSKIRRVCQSEGYSCPQICTPEHLMEKYEHAYTAR
jgi:hypothetical protein